MRPITNGPVTACLLSLLSSSILSAPAWAEAEQGGAGQTDTALKTAWVEMARSRSWQQVTYNEVDGLPMTEGDIVLPLGQSDSSRGFGRASLGSRWPNGVLPYEIDAGLNSTSAARARAAMAHWEANTGLRFVQRTTENASQYPDYIRFISSSGCSSYVGKIGGAQSIWLGPSCSTGNAIHEIGHAIGLYHEHTRPDRDSYVQVHLENIQDGKSHNFQQRLYDGDALGVYDHGSIMHYGAYYFSKNGERTISAVQPSGASFGQRSALSAGDISAANRLYGTDISISLNASPAQLNPGETIALHVQVTNQGEIDSGELSVRVPIPSGSTLQSASGVDWLCIDTGEAYCEIQNLAASANSQLIAYLTAPNHDGDLTLYAAAEAEAYDYAPGNDLDSDSVRILGSQQTASVTAGQRFTIDASSLPGTPVGSVQAQQAGTNPVTGFAIISGNDQGHFSIDADSGLISVASLGPLSDSYALGITAGSGAQQAPVTLVQVVIEQTQASGGAAGSSGDGGGPLGPLSALALLATLALRRRR